MKFGTLKSKIEEKLLESYIKKSFKNEIKNFKKLVLEDKTISSLFYLYDELNTNQGMDNTLINDYLNESVKIYENLINKVTNNKILEIKKWIGNIQTENKYETIDKLFSNDVTSINEKISSKKILSETLRKKPLNSSDSIELPIKTIVNIANKTIKGYIDNLSESEKRELENMLNEDDNILKSEYGKLKENVIEKLTDLKKSAESDVVVKINESIEKMKSENYTKLNYYKLKSLKESI
jgi:hypothetical protein